VFLQRYGAGQSQQARKTLNRLQRDITTRLSLEPTTFQRQRLETVLTDIMALSTVAFGDLSDQVRDGANDLAISEAEFSTELFNKTNTGDLFSLPADAALINAVQSAPMAVGRVGINIEDALRNFGINKSKQIQQVISDSVVLGDTTQQIGSKVNAIVSTLQRRQADALVKTVTNHASAVARESVYQENSEILDGYEWVATLDNRTTLICGSRDGIVYQVGAGPLPPAHWSCRSTTIPRVKPQFTTGSELQGDRPSVGEDGAKRVSSNTSYGGWLKKQPKGFVDEALGEERSKLFRSGKLAIDKFVDPTGIVYTLEQLRDMNPFVFL
jgi:SPP1 gp7 family putative phage head morphogenesis protein